MEKQIFKVGDKVYHYTFGWGEVISTICHGELYPIIVKFNENGQCASFTKEGILDSRDAHPTLSFTEYTFQGFSQERPLDLNNYEGKWGIFYDGESITEALLGILRDCRIDDEYKFMCKDGIWFKKFKPLSEEMVKELGLEILKD